MREKIYVILIFVATVFVTFGYSESIAAPSQIFNTNHDGDYVYFRAVDEVGNVGEWSNAQQLNIDVNPPTVKIATGYEGEIKIKEGDNNDIAKYFSYDKNGSAEIEEVTYTANGQPITNTNELIDGTYIVTCKVTKETGISASISKTIIVETKTVYGTVYAVTETEYHLVLNKTGKLAEGYTEEQRVYTTGDIAIGAGWSTWSTYANKITKAIIADKIKPQSCAYYFYNLSAMKEIENIENIDKKNVTDMGSMFSGCSSLTSLDVSGFDTSNVTNMGGMFGMCSSLTSLDVSGFNTSNVTNMSGMFQGCRSLTSLDVSGFNTSNVTNMIYMFNGCSNLTKLDVSGFNTEKVTNMQMLFNTCSSLTSLDVSGFDTSNVTTMSSMFNGCSNLKSLDVSGFNTSNVTNMIYMFNGCSNLTKLDVSGFNTEKVTSMSGMFNACSSLTSLDVSGFDTSKVTDMSYMFNGCSSLTSLDVSGFNTGKVTTTYNMFKECTNVNSLDVSGFNTENITTMYGMFSVCSKLTSLDVSGFNTANVTDMGMMFNGCSSLTSLDVSGFNTSKVKDMTSMFSRCSKLTSLDVTNFNTENVTNMSGMFAMCSGLTSIDVSSFSTEKVTNMQTMFNECSGLISIDLSVFNTSNVTNMYYMFYKCSGLTSIDLSMFNTSNVTNMSYMFNYSSKLKKIYVSEGWSTASVTSGSGMFGSCNALSGAVAWSSSNANDVTYANYTTGYLTYKPAIELIPNTTETTSGDVIVTVQYVSYLTGNKTITCTGIADVDYVINGTESITVKTNNQTITVTAQDENGKTYTNSLTIANIDKNKPTITFETNSNTTWAQTGSVVVKLKDEPTGLASGASVKYGWSTSNTTAPSSYTTATLSSYTAGTTSDVTFTANASGLTGKYYLWVVPTTLKDMLGNSQTANVISTGQFYFDNEKPNLAIVPKVNGETYNGDWTAGPITPVLTFSDDKSGIAANTLQYKVGTGEWSNSGNTSTTTFTGKWSSNNNTTGYYRIYDNAGNYNEVSFAIKIDTNNPTVSANNSSVTITAGDNVAMSTYFTTDKNGNAGISSTTYKIGSTSYTNTSSLAAGTYTVTCTVTKTTGKTASASMTLVVKAKVTVPTGSFSSIGSQVTIPEGVTKVRVNISDGRKFILSCTPGKTYGTNIIRQTVNATLNLHAVRGVVGAWNIVLFMGNDFDITNTARITSIEWSPAINELEAEGTIDSSG